MTKNKKHISDENKHGHDHCGCEHKHEHDHDHCGCEHKHEHDHDHHNCEHKHEHDHEHNHEHCGCEHHHDHNHEHKHEHEHERAARVEEYILNGLDCPHCASKIEKELEKIDGIEYAEINLINSCLTVGLSPEYSGDLFKAVNEAVKKYEPDVDVISPEGNDNKPEKESFFKLLKSEKAVIIRLIAGTVLFTIALITDKIGAFPAHVYLPLLITAYIVAGLDVVLDALRNIFHGRVFDEKFLMTVSTVGAFAIAEYPEAVAVMLFYQVGEFFQSMAVRRSRKSIADLMDIRPDSANLIKDGAVTVCKPENIRPGDIILVKPGEKLPLDGIVVEGETDLDTKALTGESMPRHAAVGDEVLSGCINENGAIKIKVTKPFGESTASKILSLVENAAGRKAPTENFISVFARYYTPIVVFMALILAIVPPLVMGGNWAKWVHRCFVFLVISCPCALVISIPLTFFGGIGAASKKGVLVKGSNYLETLSMIDAIVFDKTGTLTHGTFSISKILPAAGVDEKMLIEYAAAAEKNSTHPIARSIMAAFEKDANTLNAEDYKEHAGHGVTVKYKNSTVRAGSRKLLEKDGIAVDEIGTSGTAVYISADSKYLGCIVIEDKPKQNSAKAISGLRELGIKKAVMLTGDSEAAASSVADTVGVDMYKSELLPEGKIQFVEKLLEDIPEGGKLAFVGDGINDAPVLARADVGVAMGAMGSDAAIEAADVVLMNDDLTSLCDAVKIARFTKHIVMQNIVFILIVKAVILALGAIGIAGMWTAVFGDVGVMILAVLNSMRAVGAMRN
ncbi:MAG: cadmium-translocating P-type ATPase [Clostridia bacterium]|nr:cadmium-translocating P-type ATPase [Clostridia bacterium]